MVLSPAECCSVRHTGTASLIQGDAVPTRAGCDVETTQRPNSRRRGWSYARYGCGRCSRPQAITAGRFSTWVAPVGVDRSTRDGWPAAPQTRPPGSAHPIWTGQPADRTGHRNSSCAAEVALRTRSGMRYGVNRQISWHVLFTLNGTVSSTPTPQPGTRCTYRRRSSECSAVSAQNPSGHLIW